MNSGKLSRICYNFDQHIFFRDLDISSIKIYPDYRYTITRDIRHNELYLNHKILHLARLNRPFFDLIEYFTTQKIEDLKALLKDIFYEDEECVISLLPILEAFAERKTHPIIEAKIQKKIRKNQIKIFLSNNRRCSTLKQAAQVYRFKKNSKLTLAAIAFKMLLPLNRITYLWRLVRKEKGISLLVTVRKLEEDLQIHELFQKVVEEVLKRKPDAALSVKELLLEVKEQVPQIHIRNHSHFCTLLKKNGFHYSLFKTTLPFNIAWTMEHKEFAKMLIVELVTNTRDFRIFWTDESTICPLNFKRRCWMTKGKQVLVESDLVYNKTKIFGLLCTTGIFALQFLQGNNSQILFDNFIIEAFKRYLKSSNGHEILVLFLDNSPIHKSKKFIEFCKRNKIFLIYNLPHCPSLNPIEILWRFLKQPLKKLCRAKRFRFKKLFSH